MQTTVQLLGMQLIEFYFKDSAGGGIVTPSTNGTNADSEGKQ